MGPGRYWWYAHPARRWAAAGLWLRHALRSTKPFGETTAATWWRRARGPALCGARPPGGVWDSVGGPWGEWPDPPPCPACARLVAAAGREARR
jgi:hypothetical protein